MKKNLNVVGKILHFTEDTTKGILGKEHEIEDIHAKRDKGHSEDGINQTKQLHEYPIWNAKKRKTNP